MGGYGIFSEDGMVDGVFGSVAEAVAEMSCLGDGALRVSAVCNEHEDQEHDACADCEAAARHAYTDWVDDGKPGAVLSGRW